MKQLVFLILLVPFALSQRLTEFDAEDFKDPIELPIYQETIKNMLSNYTNVKIGRRIIGGEIAQLGQFPYTVALHMRSWRGLFMCGGSLIRYNWVLTAAHCIDDFYSIQVIVGTVNRIYGPAALNVTVTAKQNLIMHPYFNKRRLTNDIGLIRLKTATPSLLLHPFVSLIELPNARDKGIDLVGRWATVSGFGTTELEKYPSEVLKFTTVSVISNRQCSPVFRNPILRSHLCVSTVAGTTPCLGDSGGPLTTEIDRNRTVVIGVVSYGEENCSLGVPAVFSRVTNFQRWIERTINSGNHIHIEKSVGIFMAIVILTINLVIAKI